MKRILIIIALTIVGVIPSQGQSWSEFIYTIERNNLDIKRLSEVVEAQKLANKSEKMLPDPSVEFGYFWRTPSSIGNKKSFSIRQGFDLSMITGANSRLVKAMNVKTESEFRAKRIEILLDIQRVGIELYYTESILKHLSVQLENAELLEQSCARRLESGDVSKMVYNAAKSNLLKVKTDYKNVCIERDALRSRLEVLNGGTAIDVVKPEFQLPQNFDEWIKQAAEKNPALECAMAQVESDKRKLTVNRRLALPSLNVGYAREASPAETANGVVVGVSVPLWSGRNQIKQAKAAVAVSETDLMQTRLDVEAQLRLLYDKACSLQQLAVMAENDIVEANELNLLHKAVEAGEISIGDYISLAHVQYDLLKQKETLWRDYRIVMSELMSVEL